VVYSFCFELGDFTDLAPDDQKHCLSLALWALIDFDESYLLRTARGRAAPPLYDSGVVFEREPDGALNRWDSIPVILAQGHSHCVGLACWRIAELRCRHGVLARPAITEGQEVRPVVGLITEFHIIVRYPDGTHEDPSRRLGMP
jgi:hypothetical protein